MAETYKNAKLELTVGNTEIYACPTSKTAMIIDSRIANFHATDAADVTLSWTDSSDADAESEILPAVEVPIKTALRDAVGRQVLEPGDTIKGLASINSAIQVTLNIVEFD